MKAANPKVQALYEAVGKLMLENADLNRLKVSDITKKAGIGKGTAYDYFDSKEEILVSAILHFEQKVIEQVRKKLAEKEGFFAKIQYLLEAIENGNFERACLFRYLHLLSGTGALGQELRKQMEGNLKHQPVTLIYEMVDAGIQEGVLDDNLPRSYMVATVAARLCAYLMYVGSRYKNADCDSETFRELLLGGLIKELGAAEA